MWRSPTALAFSGYAINPTTGRNPVKTSPVTPDGARAYVTNAESNSVSVTTRGPEPNCLCLSARKLPPREKQNRTYKGN